MSYLGGAHIYKNNYYHFRYEDCQLVILMVGPMLGQMGHHQANAWPTKRTLFRLHAFHTISSFIGETLNYVNLAIMLSSVSISDFFSTVIFKGAYSHLYNIMQL